MAYLDDLLTVQNQIGAMIASITASPKPSYSVAGQSFSHAEYLETLVGQLAAVRLEISLADGPQEYTSQAFST